MSNYTTRENCRVCKGNFEDILSLGNQHLVGFTFPTSISVEGYSHTEEKPVYVPLDVVLCQDCKLLQLKHTTNPELLWNDNYGYRSGINDTMKKELAGLVASVESLKQLEDGDIVVDIGSNDGTLLSAYTNPKLIKVGYEPSRNVATMPNNSAEKSKIYVDFFSNVPYLQDFKTKKAKVITAVAMFYDLENPNQFIEDIETILDPEGVVVIQQNYLVGMLTQNAFDNILHEHLEFYSLLSFENLLKNHNLEVFDVSTNDINGGSFRTYLRFKGAKVSKVNGAIKVLEMRQKEWKLGLDKKEIYLKFAEKVKESTEKLSTFVQEEIAKGKKIYIFGASTRGNTLLQVAGLNYKQITAAVERNPFKWNRKMVGLDIPIISEEEVRTTKFDYALVLPWFFWEGMRERYKDLLDSGIKFIIPLPIPRLVSNSSITEI